MFVLAVFAALSLIFAAMGVHGVISALFITAGAAVVAPRGQREVRQSSAGDERRGD
jgi:hypothetical protein